MSAASEESGDGRIHGVPALLPRALLALGFGVQRVTGYGTAAPMTVPCLPMLPYTHAVVEVLHGNTFPVQKCN